MGVHYGVRPTGNGVYVPPIPVTTDGLQIYLNANDVSSYPGSGTTWFDLSGNSRNFTWSSVSFANDDGAYFLTGGRKATGPASNSVGINNTSGYTISLIFKTLSTPQSSAFKFYRSGTASSSTSRAIFGHMPWSDGVIYFDQGGCCNSDTRTSVASGGTSTWNVWTLRRLTNSSSRSIIKNGTVLTTNNNSAVNIDLSTPGIDVGGTSEDTSWNARLAGFIVYNRGLSDAEITSNYNSLKSRYNWIS